MVLDASLKPDENLISDIRYSYPRTWLADNGTGSPSPCASLVLIRLSKVLQFLQFPGSWEWQCGTPDEC